MAVQPDSFVKFVGENPTTEELIQRSTEFYKQMDLRRSLRMFAPDPVPDEVLRNIVLTAGTAPSGAHKQPWFFAIVKDSDIKHQIRLAAEEEEQRNYNERFTDEWKEDLAPFGTDAVKEYIDIVPAVIVVFKESYRVVDGEKKNNYYVNESVGIAAGMLITAIHQAGLVTLTHTPNPMKFLNEILDRPKNEVPILLLPVGYPAKDAKVPDLKRKTFDEIAKVF